MGHTVLKTILAISLALIALSPLYLKSPPADFTAGCKDLANELGHSTERCTAQYSPLTSPQEDLSTTLKWCMENRHTGSRYGLRWQHSTTLEWIDPLSAWILSAFGLLLLCPVGDKSEKEIQSQKPRQFATVKVLGDHFHSFIHSLSQFLLILGDPASSFCGVLSEVINDVRYNHFAHDKVGGDENDHQRYCIIINCCALLSQIKYTAKTALPLEFLIECKNSTSHAHDALKGILGGKVKFVSGIILPTVMYCGSCVAVIYDATYTNLGDNGTAHSLAYGIWYLWLLSLAVLSNCYGSNLNNDAISVSLKHICQLAPMISKSPSETHSETSSYPRPPIIRTKSALSVIEDQSQKYGNTWIPCETIKLHGRYMNILKWRQWLDSQRLPLRALQTINTEYRPRKDLTTTKKELSRESLLPLRKLPRYIGFQLLGWLPVAFSCMGAAIISWTTPIASLSNLVALNQYIKYNSFNPHLPIEEAMKANFRTEGYFRKHFISSERPLRMISTGIYTVLIQINVFILLAGTAFQLTGVYRSCICKAGVMPNRRNASSRIQFAVDTREHREYAEKIWVPIALGSFVVLGSICLVGVTVKHFVMFRLEKSHRLK